MGKKLIIILFVVFCMLPLALSVGYSFLYSLGAAGLLSEGITMQYWLELFQGEFLRSILYSLWIALVSASISLLLALSCLFMLRERLSNPRLYRLLFLPLTIPPIVVGFVTLQLYSGSGIFSRTAFQSGLIEGSQQFPALVQDPFGIGIVLAHLFIVFPFFLLVLLNLYRHERLEEIERVASSLGADTRTIRLKLQLPILLRGVGPLLILYIIFFMGAYEIPLLLGQSSPQMISVLILEKLQRFNLDNIPVAYAMAVWYAFLCIATVSFLLMKFKKPGTA